MKYRNGAKRIGTGVLVGDHHVLTAGHNVLSPSDGWAKEITFAAGQDGDVKPFDGAVGGSRVATFREWDRGDRRYDIGMVILKRRVGEKTGWMGMLQAPDATLNTTKLSLCGYPQSKGGVTLWGDREPVTADPHHLTYDTETAKGESGAGLWARFDSVGLSDEMVAGVHVVRRHSRKLGVRLTAELLDAFVTWLNTY